MRGGKAKTKVKEAPPKEEGGLKGDILIRDLWTQGMDSIQYMHVMNSDAVSHQSKNPEKFLENAEREKNKKYQHACLNKRRHFTPFVTSVDGLFGVK